MSLEEAAQSVHPVLDIIRETWGHHGLRAAQRFFPAVVNVSETVITLRLHDRLVRAERFIHDEYILTTAGKDEAAERATAEALSLLEFKRCSYRLQVRDTVTGKTFIREEPCTEPTFSDFAWTEGHMSCDCNRILYCEPTASERNSAPCTGDRPGRVPRYVYDWVEWNGVRIIENDKAVSFEKDASDL